MLLDLRSNIAFAIGVIEAFAVDVLLALGVPDAKLNPISTVRVASTVGLDRIVAWKWWHGE